MGKRYLMNIQFYPIVSRLNKSIFAIIILRSTEREREREKDKVIVERYLFGSTKAGRNVFRIRNESRHDFSKGKP